MKKLIIGLIFFLSIGNPLFSNDWMRCLVVGAVAVVGIATTGYNKLAKYLSYRREAEYIEWRKSIIDRLCHESFARGDTSIGGYVTHINDKWFPHIRDAYRYRNVEVEAGIQENGSYQEELKCLTNIHTYCVTIICDNMTHIFNAKLGSPVNELITRRSARCDKTQAAFNLPPELTAMCLLFDEDDDKEYAELQDYILKLGRLKKQTIDVLSSVPLSREQVNQGWDKLNFFCIREHVVELCDALLVKIEAHLKKDNRGRGKCRVIAEEDQVFFNRVIH